MPPLLPYPYLQLEWLLKTMGYMGPVKAALDSTVAFLNKSLSEDSKIRVNAVGASLLKTSASAGIPNYVNSYSFSQKKSSQEKNP